MRKTLNENTLVPIGLAIVVIGACATWVTKINDFKERSCSKQQKVNSRLDDHDKQFYEVNSHVSRLEWKIEKYMEKR